ncbi:MAG: RNA methyltransferase [Deltaproteobacteria bacterium]|nr:RNA methyltransferase [Deltaproteobacteria bacterium]
MLENIRIVLVEPRGSGNIGSVARAMKNMGLKDLAIVGGGRTKSFWARAMAVHAGEILKGSRRFSTLREAVADCSLVVGTTCRGGLYRGHSQAPREVAPRIVSAAGSGKAALVFGPEDHGLNNRDLKYCQWLVTIPAHPDYPSLNVAQAVMICLYEIYLAGLKKAPREMIARAPAESIERLFDRMRRSLLKIGFLDSQNPEHILLALRRILGRAGLEERDVHILIGLFRQMEWYAEKGWRVVEEKERKGLTPIRH